MICLGLHRSTSVLRICCRLKSTGSLGPRLQNESGTRHRKHEDILAEFQYPLVTASNVPGLCTTSILSFNGFFLRYESLNNGDSAR